MWVSSDRKLVLCPSLACWKKDCNGIFISTFPPCCISDYLAPRLIQSTRCNVCNRKKSGGGSVAVAVGASDMWQVTGDTQHLTPDTWHLTSDTSRLTFDTWQMTYENWHVTPSIIFLNWLVLLFHPPIRWEIQCPPYAIFWFYLGISHVCKNHEWFISSLTTPLNFLLCRYRKLNTIKEVWTL